MRRGLLDVWSKQERSGGREIAESDVREIPTPRQFDLQQHVDGRPRRVDGHAANHTSLQAHHR
jgi:hypothetical protein